MMPEVLITNEEETNEIEYRPMSQIYEDFLSSVGIKNADTSLLEDISSDNIIKKLNTLIELIMENVSDNNVIDMSVRNTARLFEYVINGEDTSEPGFEDVIEKYALHIGK